MQVVKGFGFALLAGVLFNLAPASAMAADHPVPRNRESLTNSDWFPYVIGKIAPMEWWHFAASLSDVRREDYPSELGYDLAKQNTWEFPRFCFKFFRPKPDVYAALLSVVTHYKGMSFGLFMTTASDHFHPAPALNLQALAR